MANGVLRTAQSPSAALDVCVDGPDGVQLSGGDLRRLFPGSTLTAPRLDRLRECPRVIVRLGDAILAVATYQKTERELRVPDLGIDPGTLPCPARDVLNALLDGIELACVAAGCRRVVANPPAVSIQFLERRGYVRVNERCAGGWIEKTVA